MNQPTPESTSIAAGAVSALGASTCCVLPLALVSMGVGGAELASKRAVVNYDPDKVTPGQLAAAVTNAGFPATVRSK
jgi:mercuric ion transport protein